MRPVQFAPEPLIDLFKHLHAVTMPEMKSVLGTQVDMTVFRKLAPWGTSPVIPIAAAITL